MEIHRSVKKDDKLQIFGFGQTQETVVTGVEMFHKVLVDSNASWVVFV